MNMQQRSAKPDCPDKWNRRVCHEWNAWAAKAYGWGLDLQSSVNNCKCKDGGKPDEKVPDPPSPPFRFPDCQRTWDESVCLAWASWERQWRGWMSDVNAIVKECCGEVWNDDCERDDDPCASGKRGVTSDCKDEWDEEVCQKWLAWVDAWYKWASPMTFVVNECCEGGGTDRVPPPPDPPFGN